MNKMSELKSTSSKIPKAIIATKQANLISYGRVEVTTKKELEKYPIGSLISYENKKNEFKTGGYIIKFAPEYFIYITPDFQTKYRVRYKNVQKMWVGNVYKVRNDIVSLVKSTQTKTKFPVTIDNIDIYYATDSYDQKRFMNTNKYKNMIKWYEYFKK